MDMFSCFFGLVVSVGVLAREDRGKVREFVGRGAEIRGRCECRGECGERCLRDIRRAHRCAVVALHHRLIVGPLIHAKVIVSTRREEERILGEMGEIKIHVIKIRECRRCLAHLCASRRRVCVGVLLLEQCVVATVVALRDHLGERAIITARRANVVIGQEVPVMLVVKHAHTMFALVAVLANCGLEAVSENRAKLEDVADMDTLAVLVAATRTTCAAVVTIDEVKTHLARLDLLLLQSIHLVPGDLRGAVVVENAYRWHRVRLLSVGPRVAVQLSVSRVVSSRHDVGVDW
jgi:hypothetical protein